MMMNLRTEDDEERERRNDKSDLYNWKKEGMIEQKRNIDKMGEKEETFRNDPGIKRE